MASILYLKYVFQLLLSILSFVLHWDKLQSWPKGLPYGKVLHHAGKGIVRHQTVPGWLGEVNLRGSQRMCWYHSLLF